MTLLIVRKMLQDQHCSSSLSILLHDLSQFLRSACNEVLQSSLLDRSIAAMAALSSCSVLKSTCDASMISSSCFPKTARMKSPKSVVSMSGPQRKQRSQEVSSAFSRRDVIFTSLSAMGMVLLQPKRVSAEEEVTDKDFREMLLQEIDNLQQLVSKSLGDAKEAVTTKAEEAMSSLKDDKAAQTLTEVKSTIDETAQQQQDKLAQN